MLADPVAFFGGAMPWEQPRAIHAQVRAHGNIALIIDNEDTLIPRGTDWDNWEEVRQIVINLVSAFFGSFEDEYDFVTFFTERNLPFYGASYFPFFNDVTGIGYQRQRRTEVFDVWEGGRRVQGLILMNNYRNYLGAGYPLGRMIFNQEIGHRWGTRVHAQIDGADSDELLGRDLTHWSYFFHTNDSAMEGNNWEDEGRGLFTTRTRLDRAAYNPLDLYLMGFLSPEEADRDDLFLIREPRLGGRALNRASTPQYVNGPVSVGGNRHNVSVNDIIRIEGDRHPTFENSPREFRMAFVLVLRSSHGLDDEDFDDFDELRGKLTEDWVRDTGGDTILHSHVGQSTEHGAACRFNTDCSPAKCEAPADGEDKICLPLCATEAGCPNSWCCGGDPEDEEALCLPPEHCEVPTPDAGPGTPDAGPAADATPAGDVPRVAEGEGEAEAEGEGEEGEGEGVGGDDGGGGGGGGRGRSDGCASAGPRPLRAPWPRALMGRR